MNGLKRIFGGINSQYMIRAYILGTLFFALMMFPAFSRDQGIAERSVAVAYLGLSTLLFPFTKLVWDQLKRVALGETLLILPIIFLYPAKLFVNLFLFSFAVFIAPFGIAYIWFKTKA